MEKYLGNKRVLLDSIYQFITHNTLNTTSIIDIFSGTTNVSRYFRNKGYEVVSNDINRFSYLLGLTYLTNKEIPQFNKLNVPDTPKEKFIELENNFMKSIKKDKTQLFTYDEKKKELYYPVFNVLNYLNNLENLNTNNTHIIDYFCTSGKNSKYKSMRGTEINRNYFSLENAKKINIILEQVRLWWREKLLNKQEISLLLTSIIEEIVLVANVTGTFHDFHRSKLWSNSLQTFNLKMPLTIISNAHSEIYCQDALELVKNLGYKDILYIDPPYNFRQYTSYYHFLNFVGAYPFIEDLDEYMHNITFVRGQNPDDEFKSKFSFKNEFLKALEYLIINTECKYVVMSYYGGKNHWNNWSKKEEKCDFGFNEINKIFQNKDIFKYSKSEETFKVRQNFQSRIGEQKQMIDEYLFFGEKKQFNPTKEVTLNDSNLAENNKKFNLSFFDSFVME